MAAGPRPGTAPVASGGKTMPPRDISSFSRAVHARSWAADGATPETPMNGAPGMRTPGSFGDVAQPSRICQWTRYGVVNTSRRKPSPGTIAVNACGCGTMSRNSISSTSPGRAPLTKTGPVRGWMAPASILAMSASVVPGPSWPSTPSRVASTTSSPSSTVRSGGMSG